jgi:hypothetical protein
MGARLRLVPSIDSAGLEHWTIAPDDLAVADDGVFGRMVAGTPFVVRKSGDSFEVMTAIGGVRRSDAQAETMEFSLD